MKFVFSNFRIQFPGSSPVGSLLHAAPKNFGDLGNYHGVTGTVTFDPAVVDAETIAKSSTVYPAKVVSVNK